MDIGTWKRLSEEVEEHKGKAGRIGSEDKLIQSKNRSRIKMNEARFLSRQDLEDQAKRME